MQSRIDVQRSLVIIRTPRSSRIASEFCRSVRSVLRLVYNVRYVSSLGPSAAGWRHRRHENRQRAAEPVQVIGRRRRRNVYGAPMRLNAYSR